MSAATVAPAAARPHFQFTLGMLLVAMAWSGLVCVALRSPTGFWTGALFVLTLLVLLTMVLVAVYRTGRLRAFGIGFLVFGAGYLLCWRCWQVRSPVHCGKAGRRFQARRPGSSTSCILRPSCSSRLPGPAMAASTARCRAAVRQPARAA